MGLISIAILVFCISSHVVSTTHLLPKHDRYEFVHGSLVERPVQAGISADYSDDVAFQGRGSVTRPFGIVNCRSGMAPIGAVAAVTHGGGVRFWTGSCCCRCIIHNGWVCWMLR